jgi:hypothetical protein
MKKLIALTLVAVMLVAMSVSVLASETVNAYPVENTSIFDGTISEGEYGDPVTYITTDKAYDDDSEDEIEGCQSYKKYQGVDPFDMDAYIYIAYMTNGADDNRLYFCADVSARNGKVIGGENGLTGGDHWDNDSIQFRASGDAEWTDDPAEQNLWGEKTFNIIVAAYTFDMENDAMADGQVIKSLWNKYQDETWDFSASENGGILSSCDHVLNRPDLTVSGKFAGSLGLHGDRFHVETILRTEYFAEGTDLEVLDVGDEFPCSFIVFNAEVSGDTTKWAGMLTWGHGISGYNNGLGVTGTNNVVIAEAPVEETSEETQQGGDESTEPDSEGGEEGDALIVIVATAIMALGTAVIVKKVR